MKICMKRGERYAAVDTAQLNLGDHRATLTLPGGTPLVNHAHGGQGHLRQGPGRASLVL